MENKEILELTTSAWREKVYIETAEHIICGYIFMPKIGKKARLLSDVLNGNKNFIAVKNCKIEYKLNPSRICCNRCNFRNRECSGKNIV